MADTNGSLRVATEDDGDIVAFISDATIPAQKLAVNADGSINITDNAGSITVDGVQIDIDDLTFADDKVDVTGSEVSLDAATLAALENITVSATDLDIRDLVFATDKVDVSGSEVSLDAATLAALETITVVATQLDIDDLNATDDIVSAYISDEAGVAWSAANPLPVSIVDGAGTEVNDYNTAAAIASDATSNHDYAITADFLLKRVWAAASSEHKIEVQIDTGAGYNTIAVGFGTVATPNVSPEFAPVQLANTDSVRVIRTNLDNQAQDLYSTVIGIYI